ncbi:MAG: ATP-binding protein [Bacteroidota bacterium]
MLKNITLNQVTGILTTFVVVLQLVVLALLAIVGVLAEYPIWIWLVVALSTGVASYLGIKFFVDKFIFRKIKVIYKLINKSKKSLSDDESKDLFQRSIDDVNEDVVTWAQRKESEIAHLTDLETYRRNFVGNISHELKTPIFSIQGYLHTLLDGGMHDERINMKYLERAASNLDRLERIVNDLETINRLESGKFDLHKTQFDLRELAKDVVDDLAFLAKEKNIHLKLKDGASKPFTVEADMESIRQVLNNLVANSIKYGKPDGKTKLGFYDMDDRVLIEVSDNGIGIRQEHLNHVFDRFYRVDTGRGRREGGSGLGLAIVKHILEAHEESINVRSTEGEGSTFGFTLRKSKK